MVMLVVMLMVMLMVMLVMMVVMLVVMMVSVSRSDRSHHERPVSRSRVHQHRRSPALHRATSSETVECRTATASVVWHTVALCRRHLPPPQH